MEFIVNIVREERSTGHTAAALRKSLYLELRKSFSYLKSLHLSLPKVLEPVSERLRTAMILLVAFEGQCQPVVVEVVTNRHHGAQCVGASWSCAVAGIFQELSILPLTPSSFYICIA